MAIQKKRSRDKVSISSARPRSYSELYKGDNSVPAAALSATGAAVREINVPVMRGSDTVEWQKEYAHVVSDVRALLVVSGVLFALIIAAGFFI